MLRGIFEPKKEDVIEDDHALAEAVCCWLLTMEACICAQIRPCGIYDGQSSNGQFFVLSYLVFLCWCHFITTSYSLMNHLQLHRDVVLPHSDIKSIIV